MADYIGLETSGHVLLEDGGGLLLEASTVGGQSWLWDFGDSHTSTEQNPVHVYEAAGTYTVSLTVTLDGESDTETKSAYITTLVGVQIVAVGGVPSPQAFGQVAASTAQTVQVGSVPSAQGFGQPTFEPPRLRPTECLLADLDPAGRTEAVLAATVCETDGPLLLCGTFLCGERVLPRKFIGPTFGSSTLTLGPSGRTMVSSAPTSVVALGLGASERLTVTSEPALTVATVLAAKVCIGDEPFLICNTFLCGERRLPRRFLASSPAPSILHLDPADVVTLELEPAEVS